MFERLTSDARDVVTRAQEHALRLGHDWTGCEHLLLAIAGSATSPGALFRGRGARPETIEEAMAAIIGPGPGAGDDKVLLATVGIDLDQVRRTVETTFGAGALDAARSPGRRRRWRTLRRRPPCTTASGRRPLTPRAKRCLELSLRESLRLNDNHVGVEHMALALLERDDTAAWKVLLHMGVVPPELRQAVEEEHRGTA